MNFNVRSGKIENLKSSLLAMFLYTEDKTVPERLKQVDKISGAKISEILKLRDFSGELNETALIYLPAESKIKRILLVGSGKKREFNIEKSLQVFGTAAKAAKKLKLRSFGLYFNSLEPAGISKNELACAAAESAILSLYAFEHYKTKDKKKSPGIQSMTIFDSKKSEYKAILSGTAEGKLIAEGTCYARDLANHPGNVVTPSYLADEAKKIAEESGMKCTIFDEKKLKELKMNALLSVAQGSHQPPRFIILEYKCNKKSAKTVAIVGKGLTFDAGGISLKPAKSMEEMKYDMCGSAAVLGLMKIINELKPPVNVLGVIASAENLPGGGAVKPGDIIKTYEGTTVEIINTDAEGRLVLSDALAYTVDKFKPSAMIDLATLTGAVIVALGHYATGMLGNNSGLLKKVSSAGKKSGEPVWELPIYPEFDEHIKSDVADIKNSNGSGAGTIFGAAFLQKFIGKTKWVHLDIAGTAWDVKEKSYLPKGPTGVGVRLLSRLLSDWQK